MLDLNFANDVDLDEQIEKQAPGELFDLPCGECQKPMVLRASKKYGGWFYGCSTFPKCRGSHGAHPDGRPKGIPGNKATKKARVQAHKVFDQLWGSDSPLGRRRLTRNGAYRWLQGAMGLSSSKGHISNFDIKGCEKLIRRVYHDFPMLRTRWSRLAYDESVFDSDVLDGP